MLTILTHGAALTLYALFVASLIPYEPIADRLIRPTTNPRSTR